MIVTALNEDKEAPWYRGRDSKGLTREKLSTFLRRYKIKPEQQWHSDIKQVLRGYYYLNADKEKAQNSLKLVFDQYLGPENES